MARRVTRLAQQADMVLERAPDVLCLQEVTARSAALWREALEGYEVALSPLETRGHGVLTATRAPHEPLPARLEVPWPESAVSVSVDGVEVHCVHVPNAANGWIKPRTLAAVRLGLENTSPPAPAQILCGDLNTPRRESRDGEVMSFACDSRGRLRPERGEAWDMAERAVVPGLADIGFRDAFRSVHGYAVQEKSWVWQKWGGGYRLDHVFCSARLQPVAAQYHHAWREEGLSDHSALEADLLLG